MRFVTVNLSMNVGHLAADIFNVNKEADCNPGGSTICTTGTQGCGGAGLTCVGTSSAAGEKCGAASDIVHFNFDSRILVEKQELESLHAELNRVLVDFAKRTKQAKK